MSESPEKGSGGLSALESDLLSHLASRLDDRATGAKTKKSRQAPELAGRLAPAVKELWKLFNSKRPKNLPAYMEDPETRLAYLASYFLPNVERTGSLLRRYAQDITVSLAQTKRSQKSHFQILDLGAGPLSASLAFCQILDDATLPAPRFGPRPTLEILAVERSQEIFEDGLALGYRLWESLQAKGYDLSITRLSLRALLKKEPGADVILAANLLNELGPAGQGRLKDWLSSAKQRATLLLFMEPGQDCHSQALAAFRDSLLSGSKRLSILGPCPHQQSCPLGPASGRKDWCWFRLATKPSPWTKALDACTGLDHRELSYSYVCLTTRGKGAQSAWGRVVSDDIDLSKAPSQTRNRLFIHLRNQAVKAAKGHEARMPLRKEDVTAGTLHKVLICHQSGKLYGHFLKTKPTTSRGEILLSPPRHGYLAKEREGTNEKTPAPTTKDRKKQTSSFQRR